MKKSVHTPEYAALRSELRAFRTAAGLTQRQLADRLNVPNSWVAKVEIGERRIDVVELCWFADACGFGAVAAFTRLAARWGLVKPRGRQ